MRLLAVTVVAVVSAAALAACKGRDDGAVDVKAELEKLERVLADTADRKDHPVLTDADLEPLRGLGLRSPRVAAARAACVSQYEALVQAQEETSWCHEMEAAIEARVREGAADAGDPLLLIVQAQEVCGRAETAIDRVERLRHECDEATGRIRKELGLPH